MPGFLVKSVGLFEILMSDFGFWNTVNVKGGKNQDTRTVIVFWILLKPHDQPIKGLRLGFCHRVADANITINLFPGNSAMIQEKIVPVCGSNEDLSQGLSRWLRCAPSTCCVLVKERVRERERERPRPSGSTQRQDFVRSVQRAASSQLTKEQKSGKQNK